MDKIVERIDPFFEAVEEALHPPTAQDRVIPSTELQELARKIKQAFLRFMTLGVSESLVLRSLGNGNTLVDGTRCVFLDWAGCCISHPFWALEHLLALAKKDQPENSDWERMLRHAYSSVWRHHVPKAALTQLHALSPLMALLLDALESFYKLKIAGFNQPVLGRELHRFLWRMKREFDRLISLKVA